MTTVKVTANGQGEYWFDVEVAGERKTALMDTGFTGAAAVAVNRENWDRIKNALTERGSGGTATDYQGNATTVEYGKARQRSSDLKPKLKSESSTLVARKTCSDPISSTISPI